MGCDTHGPVGRGSGSSRNGARSKTVVTDSVGAIQIEVPRDRDGASEPQLVNKRRHRLPGRGAAVLSLLAKGLTGGEIAARLAEMCGTSVGKDTISRVTGRVIDEMNTWMSRSLGPVYAAVLIGAIVVKLRDGRVRDQPCHATVGVGLEGRKDIVGIRPGNGDGGPAKLWSACPAKLWSACPAKLRSACLTRLKKPRRHRCAPHGLRRPAGSLTWPA
ncbi:MULTISPECIES: transposase [Actinomyces]|uniref:transposase n=1 Tax=Actinomyces TaxID=1654 RepID=UPI0031456BB3